MRLSSMPFFAAIASIALLAGCGDQGTGTRSNGPPEPEPLADGGWTGPAQLMNCWLVENCEQDRWANQSEFEVIVWNEDAEVSSSDPDVLEIVSVERGNPIPTLCIFNCGGPVDEELSVILRTKSVGDAELIIDGPAGDQRRLPVHVADIDTIRLVDGISGDPIEVIDPLHPFVRLDAEDAEGGKLAAYGRWSIDDPDAALLQPGPLTGSDTEHTLERSASALVISNEPSPASTMLRVTIGENALDLPVEL